MKNKILEYLFRRYTQDIKSKAEEASELKFEAYKATINIGDVISERYRGIRKGRPGGLTLLEEKLASLEDDNSRLAFLGKAYDIIKNNETFKVVVDSLLADSVENAGVYAEDMTNVNFNRAEGKGVLLVEEELGRLSSMYISEKDKNTPMTEEEKQAIIN